MHIQGLQPTRTGFFNVFFAAHKTAKKIARDLAKSANNATIDSLAARYSQNNQSKRTISNILLTNSILKS